MRIALFYSEFPKSENEIRFMYTIAKLLMAYSSLSWENGLPVVLESLCVYPFDVPFLFCLVFVVSVFQIAVWQLPLSFCTNFYTPVWSILNCRLHLPSFSFILIVNSLTPNMRVFSVFFLTGKTNLNRVQMKVSISDMFIYRNIK